jgi:dihydroneopterin aldolase
VIEIEINGLEVFGYHGATEVEEREGQTFLFDVVLRPRHEPSTDDIAETIDYREVATCIREVSERQRVRLLETLAASVADELIARFALEGVRVRVRKPDVQLDPSAAYTAAVVERP